MLDEGDAFVVAQATREARHGLAQRETRSLSGRDVEAASGGTGVDEAGAVSSIFSGSESSWSLPVTESLNSRIPRPSDLPISGRRLGPKTSRRTRIMTTAPCQPMLPGMGPRIARSGTPGTPRGSRYTGWVTRWAGAPAWNLRKGCYLALLEIRNRRVAQRGARDHGPERVRKVDPRLCAHGASCLRDHRRRDPPRRREHRRNGRRRARTKGSVPCLSVSARRSRGDGRQLSAPGGQLDPQGECRR